MVCEGFLSLMGPSWNKILNFFNEQTHTGEKPWRYIVCENWKTNAGKNAFCCQVCENSLRDNLYIKTHTQKINHIIVKCVQSASQKVCMRYTKSCIIHSICESTSKLLLIEQAPISAQAPNSAQLAGNQILHFWGRRLYLYPQAQHTSTVGKFFRPLIPFRKLRSDSSLGCYQGSFEPCLTSESYVSLFM